jgi:hypothetical protein
VVADSGRAEVVSGFLEPLQPMRLRVVSAMSDELQRARELLERVAKALPVLETTLRKAAEIVKADHDMGAHVARDMFEDVRQFLKPKEEGSMVVSGVHPHAPWPYCAGCRASLRKVPWRGGVGHPDPLMGGAIIACTEKSLPNNQESDQ